MCVHKRLLHLLRPCLVKVNEALYTQIINKHNREGNKKSSALAIANTTQIHCEELFLFIIHLKCGFLTLCCICRTLWFSHTQMLRSTASVWPWRSLSEIRCFTGSRTDHSPVTPIFFFLPGMNNREIVFILSRPIYTNYNHRCKFRK